MEFVAVGFFLVYIHDLVAAIEISKLGYLFGDIFVGSIFNVDDILLMSGFVTKLQLMLDLCLECAFDNDLVFNGKNSSRLVFEKIYNCVDLMCMCKSNGYI